MSNARKNNLNQATRPGTSRARGRALRHACRWLAAIGIASAVALGGGILVAAPASAATLCHDIYGNFTCKGLDPIETTCAQDAYVVNTGQAAVAGDSKIELFYSRSCDANWASVSPAHNGWGFFIQNSRGDMWSDQVPGEKNFYDGKMVDGKDGTVTDQACWNNVRICATEPGFPG